MAGRQVLIFLRVAVLAVAISLGLGMSPALGQIDPSGDWRTWRTPHFRVHAQTSLGAAAQHAAFEAERAYLLLTSELERPRGIIDLVVAHNVDYSNGWATVFPSNRLSIFLAPPTGSPSLGNYDGWLRLVLIHELTHLFHLDRTKGLWKVLQGVFGRAPALFPNVYQPSWVGEGLATYYESRFSTAGRAKGSFHRGLLAAAAENGVWPSQGDVWLTSSDWPGGHRPYAWGGEFFTAQAALHGDSLVPRLVERTSGQLWPFAVSAPLRGSGGESVADGWQRLLDRAAADAGPRPPSRTVIERGLRAEPRPRVSPDGQQLAYVKNSGKAEAHVVVRSLDTWEEIDAKRVNGSADLAWVGDTLYVVQLDFTSPVEIVGDLYCWLPGESWHRVTKGARLSHPFATHDGHVAAVDKGAEARRLLAYRDGNLTVFPAPPGDAFARVAVAPETTLIAGARHRDGRWDIVLWRADSAAPERLVTDDRAMESDPVWSDDGRRLFFASEREGLSQIFVYRMDDGAIVRVTAEPTGAREPAPVEGTSLYFSTLLHDGYALVKADMTDDAFAVGTTPAPEAFEPAPEVSLLAGGFNPWPALIPRYWIPFWHDEGNTGLFLNALTTGEDPIGRTYYLAAVGATFDPFRWETQLGVVHTRWKRFQLDASVAQRWDGIRATTGTGALVLQGERERRGDFGLGWRWRQVRSAIDVRAGAGLEQQAYYDEQDGGRFAGSSPTFFVSTVRARAAHASRPILSISPENGVIVDGFYKRRWGISDPDWSYQIRGRTSGYLALPLPGFSHWVLAAELEAGRTGGTVPERLEIGGESGDLLETIPGLAFGSGRRAFSMRGYPRGGAFTRAFTGVLELRVPVALVAKGWTRMPVFLDRVSLTGFAEVGGGWLEGEEADLAALRDVGAEIVLDIGLIRDYPIRIRGGAAVPLRDGLGVSQGHVRWYLALGSAF
jgi:hypothetical protein